MADEIDIIIVTHNSEKWFDGFFRSIRVLDFPLDKINLIFVDNSSSDNTVFKLKNIKSELQNLFLGFEIVESSVNLGFGKANNIGVKYAKTDFLFFLNIDTELFNDSLSEIFKAINENKNSSFKAWELRQFPYEHPKIYDPLTGETPWSSGAALIISKDVFINIKGFDSRIFMYGEDVDISWRILLEGYKLRYLPRARVKHYSYQGANEVKPTQYMYSIINHLYLRFKYGSLMTIMKGLKLWMGVFKHYSPIPNGRVLLLKEVLKNSTNFIFAFFWRLGKLDKFLNCKNETFGIQLLNWDYSKRRKGDFYEANELSNEPFVSVLIRTCSRPSVLRETLISLRNQTYRNFEVVIIEDGPPDSEFLVKNEFSDLDINYFSLQQNQGRSRAGNYALKMAKGGYCNFLDDDDLFYADHLEVLVREILKEKDLSAVYGIAYATPIKVLSKDPYKYEIHDYRIDYEVPYNKLKLTIENYLPIQTVLFKKSLFEEEGGFDESIEYCEDWDLWLRYSLNHKFKFIPKVTSLYRIPFDGVIANDRQEKLDSTLGYLSEKHANLELKSNLRDIRESLEYIIAQKQPYFIHERWYKILQRIKNYL